MLGSKGRLTRPTLRKRPALVQKSQVAWNKQQRGVQVSGVRASKVAEKAEVEKARAGGAKRTPTGKADADETRAYAYAWLKEYRELRKKPDKTPEEVRRATRLGGALRKVAKRDKFVHMKLKACEK